MSISNKQWDDFTCTNARINPNCVGKYCESWSWRSRKSVNAKDPITWADTKNGHKYAATWIPRLADCPDVVVGAPCSTGIWHVNIPNIDDNWNNLITTPVTQDCYYTGVVSKDNIIYLTTSTQIKVLSSNYEATLFDGRLFFSTGFNYVNIQGIGIDSKNKIYVLDKGLNKIACYLNSKAIPLNNEQPFTTWGGFGGRRSSTRFNQPSDLHIDNIDYIWVADTGNACIKRYTNTGAWAQTIIDDVNMGYSNPPISMSVDVSGNCHVLTNNGVYVYNSSTSSITLTGTPIYSYKFSQYTTQTPKKITNNYKREMMYIVFDDIVLKYFRTGVFASKIINTVPGLSGIQALYHDEHRNLLVTFQDNIYKDIDLMILKHNKGVLPDNFWSKEQLLINKEEYVQNWVYNKSFQRLWDDIEFMRHTIFYKNTNKCNTYVPPIYSKEEVTVGQNEIVTSTVINRCIDKLWANYETLINYFDPNCKS
jgi:hypothetical protein